MLFYHLVFPVKYRRAVLDDGVDKVITLICAEIESVEDHIHFLVKSVPMYSITKLVTMIKSLTAREVFKNVLILKNNYGVENFGLMAVFQVMLVSMAMNLWSESM
jgi:putative transposase